MPTYTHAQYRIEHAHDHGHGHGHDHAEKEVEKPKKRVKKTHNLSLVSSVGFTIVGLLDVALFNTFMTTLLAAKAADLYRTKGVLAFAGQGDVKFVFQGVHEQINFGPSEHAWGEGVARDTKMVFIGKNLDYEVIYVPNTVFLCYSPTLFLSFYTNLLLYLCLFI
jgi:G3E family GTPase